jgi:hypothetical protein
MGRVKHIICSLVLFSLDTNKLPLSLASTIEKGTVIECLIYENTHVFWKKYENNVKFTPPMFPVNETGFRVYVD